MGTKKVDKLRDDVSLQAGNHIIQPSESEKLLGCNIHQGMKWKEHVQTNTGSLIRQLTSRVNALRKLAVNATFQTRLMAANAVFISVLSYLIPLWGGCEGYLIKALQVIQNKAARCVTRQSWFTPTRRLLSQCSWLSIRQLVFYHTVLTFYKILKSSKPLYLSNKLSRDYPYPTRLAAGGCVRYTDSQIAESSLTEKSFLCRGTRDYNSIPADLKAITSLQTFKKKLKVWILANIPID